MNESLTIDDLRFNVRRSDRRASIGITVERDGALIIDAPSDCPEESIEQVARAKRFWIYNKLARQELLFRSPIAKEFVSGEGFEYLGRSYRLLLITPSPADQPVPPLRLHQSRFLLRRDAVPRARQHFIAWYIEHGQVWLQRRVSLLAARIGVAPASIQVRDLGYRWGSCSHDGGLHFHWRAILLPPTIIEYIAAHELVHLREPHHDGKFWQRVQQAMPDYAARKGWLAEHGGRFTV